MNFLDDVYSISSLTGMLVNKTFKTIRSIFLARLQGFIPDDFNKCKSIFGDIFDSVSVVVINLELLLQHCKCVLNWLITSLNLKS